MSKQPAQAGTSIEDKLIEAWKQEQRFFHLRGLGRFLIWLVAMVLVDFVVDWQIFFRARWESPGVLLLILNVAVLSWVLWREWIRHLKPYDPLRVALEVENKHPKLRSVLVSFTQLKDFNAEEARASPELLEAMRKQAISLTRPLDFREVVDFGQLKKLALVSLGCIGLFLAINFQWEEHMRRLLLRLQGKDVEYPTETTILTTSGNITIKSGDPAKIFVIVEGKSPTKGTLFERDEGEDEWTEIEIERGSEQSYSRKRTKVINNYRYKFKIGDDVSDEYAVSISPRPEPISKKITLSYPGYLERKDTSEENLNLTVPAGTHIKWRLQCDPKIRALKVNLGDKTIVADVLADGSQAFFETTANETFKYSFHWTEKVHGFEYPPEIQYRVRVVPDRLPDVELIEPSGNGVATVNKVLQLKARATDDYQLADATLVYSIIDRQVDIENEENNATVHKRKLIKKLSGTQQEFVYEWVLNEELAENEKLTPGCKVIFHIEVGDRKPPSDSRLSASVQRRLTILSEEQYLDWFEKELAAQREIIIKARNAEVKATNEISKLKVEENKE